MRVLNYAACVIHVHGVNPEVRPLNPKLEIQTNSNDQNGNVLNRVARNNGLDFRRFWLLNCYLVRIVLSVLIYPTPFVKRFQLDM
jgi:hypothetical protein